MFSGLTLLQLALGGLPSIDLLLNRQTRSETRSQHKYSQQFFSYIFPPDLVHVLLGRVLVASVPRGDVELEVKAGVLEVVIVGQLVRNVTVQGHGDLVNPVVSDVTFLRILLMKFYFINPLTFCLRESLPYNGARQLCMPAPYMRKLPVITLKTFSINSRLN